MLHKFERYISKNIPQNALAIIQTKASIIPYDYKGLPATGNSLYNWCGWEQRQRVEPTEYNLNENKDRVGKNFRQSFGPRTEGIVHNIFAQHSAVRKVVAFQSEINHMQSTPYVRRGQWHIQWENTGFYRSHGMLWGRNSEDPYRTWGNRYEVSFPDMNSAVTEARKRGYEIDLVYPHERYHTQKAYADNYNFIKETVSDIEDEEEIVYDLMQKLA